MGGVLVGEWARACLRACKHEGVWSCAHLQELKRLAVAKALEEIQKEKATVDEEAKAARARSVRVDSARAEQKQRQARSKQQHDAEMNVMRGDLNALYDQVSDVGVRA